jgi:hypothetical protein
MKMLSTILALMMSLTALAQTPPPVSLKGQAGTKLLPKWNLQVPNNQATNLGGIDALIETGNDNLLANPNFEHSTVANSWTSGGTASAPVVETSNVPSGKQSLCWNSLSAKTFTLTQDSTIGATAFADGTVQGVASIRMRTNHTGAIDVCTRQAASTSTTNCIQVVSSAPTATQVLNNNQWALYRIPFLFGGTSQGISISAASGTGTTCVDDATVEVMKDFDTVPVVTATKDWTPTSTLSTNVTHTGKYALVGDRAYIEFLVTFSGVNTQGAFELNMPTGLVIDTAKLLGADHTGRLNGFFAVRDASGASTGELPGGIKVKDSGTVQFFVSDDVTGSDKFAVSVNTSTGSPITFASGDTLKGYFNVPIVAQNSTINTYTDQCSTDVACTNTFSARVSVTGVVSGENQDFINGNCALASSVFTCTWNSSIFTGAPNCTATTALGGTNRGVDIGAVSTSSGVFRTYLSDVGSATDAAFNIECTRGSDFVARKQIVGSFKDTPKTIGSSGSDIQSVYFGTSTNCTSTCTTGTCSVCTQIGNKITSVTWQATGEYRLNGIDGTKYQCTGTSFNTNPGAVISDKSGSTSTYARITTYSGTGSADGARVSVSCIGVP